MNSRWINSTHNHWTCTYA